MCNITGKKPSQLDDPQVPVDNTAWLVIETPADGKVVKINPNDLPNLGGSNTYFNDETGGNAPGAPANPDTPPAGAANGDTVIEFYDDKLLFWSYDGADWTLEYTHVLSSGGGNALETYSAGNGAYVTADGLTITYTKSAGLGTFTIPSTQKMTSFRVFGNAGDLSGGELRLVFNGGRNSGTNFNTSNADLYHPTLFVTNRTKVLPDDPELQRPDDAGDSINIFEEAFIANGQVSVKITGLSGDFEIKGTF